MNRKLYKKFIEHIDHEGLKVFSNILVDMLTDKEIEDLSQFFEINLRLKGSVRKSPEKPQIKPESKVEEKPKTIKEVKEMSPEELELLMESERAKKDD